MKTHSCFITLFRTLRRFVSGFALLLCSMASGNAASDADVTIIKATKVVIEENVITIVAEARTTVTLIYDDYNPDYKGDNWHGMPVTRVKIASAKGTFIIKRQHRVKPEGLTDAAAANFKAAQEVDDKAWDMTVAAAKKLQAGNKVGRIGYYAPDMTIKGNLIDSMTGFGYLYP
jgi:hypothetical protein